MPSLDAVLADAQLRRELFPVTTERIYLAHAGVAPLAGPARDALIEHARTAAVDNQEAPAAWEAVADLRRAAASLMGVEAGEISLLGPTALGLNTVAHGIDWREGDEVVCHARDYPSNVYPWADLERRGVKLIRLEPERPGVIEPDQVAAALSPRTRLVALASCHFLSGYRIDVAEIGRRVQAHGALFCLDAIQTLGAFPTPLDHVDFAAADGHKWLLGPCGAGIFYCARERRDDLRPALLGSWNVISPDFITQDVIAFEAGGRRFEPGTLNLAGSAALAASIGLLDDFGIAAIADRLLHLRAHLLTGLRERGWLPIHGALEDKPDADRWRSGILTVTHTEHDLAAIHRGLLERGVAASLRKDASGAPWLRFSPHAYLMTEDLDEVLGELDRLTA